MRSVVYFSAWIKNPTALPFGRLAQRGGASIAIFQQKNMRVSPKGMGEKAPQEVGERGWCGHRGKEILVHSWERSLLTEYDPP
jgi:hypothetical protein